MVDEAEGKALLRDRRSGARALGRRLLRARQRAQEEAERLDAMLRYERGLWDIGVRHVAGIDEVGVGALAGPVVAAAVVFAPGTCIAGIDDSKKISRAMRERLDAEIRARAWAVGIGVANVAEIDAHNILQAGRLAMRRAVEKMPQTLQHLLVDARTVPDVALPQTSIIGGDGESLSVAAASIVAKVTRDATMAALHLRYPPYRFGDNMGYGTPDHLCALQIHGPSPVHRLSFAPVKRSVPPARGGRHG